MQQHYEEEFKKKIVRLHLEEGRTLKSGSILCEGNRLMVYRFIQDNHKEF